MDDPAAVRTANPGNASKEDKLVFLDFDGVICDSLPECYEVSLAAYYGIYLKTTVPDDTAVDTLKVFRHFRPYIRRGGDYLFIQLAIHQGISLESQEDFDTLVSAHINLDDTFHELFYSARNHLFNTNPDRWYALNPLYPGIKDMLQKRGNDPTYLILSTKEARFIAQILAHHGLDWDINRIYCSGKERKLGFIDNVMDRLEAKRALFLDDQPDHFKGQSLHPVRCLLADWGYIQPDWLTSREYQIVTLRDVEAILDAG